MIIYNPLGNQIIKERIKEAEGLLNQIPAKHCFITGSFLYKKDYKDIDVFAITRKKISISLANKKAKLTLIDFNDIYSLFYHSISKNCISKGILPVRPLKVTISDYWHVINEAIPAILNQKGKYHKDIRFLILYTEYFRTGYVLDTYQLNHRIGRIRDYKEILEYVKNEAPKAINMNSEISYIRRFFYTQAGFYKDSIEYKSQNFLYELAHMITRGVEYGGS